MLNRAESLAAAGLTEATAAPGLYSGDDEPSLPWGRTTPGSHGAVPTFSHAAVGTAEGPPAPPDWHSQLSPSFGETIVDIYVTAGLHGDYPNASCDHNDKSACGLWWIQMILPSNVVLIVQQLQTTDPDPASGCPNGRYHLQAAANPGGTKYAWQRNCKTGTYDANGDEIDTSQIRTSMAPSQVGPAIEDIVYQTNGLAQFPNWYDADTILFNQGSMAGQTQWVISNVATAPAATAAFGPNGAAHNQRSYEDGFTHSAPTYPGAVGTPRVVSFGGRIDANPNLSERIPQVTDINGDFRETFWLPAEWRDPALGSPECHHPAWNPWGNRILCTRYQDPESWPGFLADMMTSHSYELRRLYTFQKSNVVVGWVLTGEDSFGTRGALVEPLTDAEFNKIPGFGSNLFPPRADLTDVSAGCTTYVWKFGEWCASERFLVATISCSGTTLDAGGLPTTLHSRVVLIDTENSGPADGYTDLTTMIEREVNPLAALGRYSGFFGSCGWSQTVLGAASEGAGRFA